MVKQLPQASFASARFDDSSLNLHTMIGRPAKTLLLFVHGLNGRGYGTWGRTPEFLFSQQEHALDVALFDYRSGFRLRLGAQARLRRWVRQLSEHLTTLERDYSDIILIGHSQGGVIIEAAVKEYLTSRALDGRRGTGAIAALILLGSPRAGTTSVRRPVAALVPSLAHLVALNETSAEIESFFASQVDRLGVAQTNRHFHLPTYAGLASDDRFVTEYSAAGQIPARQRKTFTATHTQLVKATAPDAELVKWLLGVVKEAVEIRTQSIRLQEHAERQAALNAPKPPPSPEATLVTELLCDPFGIDFEEIFNEERGAVSAADIALIDARDAPDYRVDVVIAADAADNFVEGSPWARDAVLLVRERLESERAALGSICPVGPAFRAAETIVAEWLMPRPRVTSIYVSGTADLDGYRAHVSRLFRLAAARKSGGVRLQPSTEFEGPGESVGAVGTV